MIDLDFESSGGWIDTALSGLTSLILALVILFIGRWIARSLSGLINRILE